MTGEERFPVGSTVIKRNWRMGNRARTTEMVVTKVARKYVTAIDPDRRYPMEEKFDKVTGQAPGESGDFIQTVADLAEAQARLAARERLKAIGFRSTHEFPRELSAEALQAIADVAVADLGIVEEVNGG